MMAPALLPALLIILCHGHGSDSRQLAGLKQAWGGQFPGAVFVMPDAPEPCRRRLWGTRGRQWWSLKLPRAGQIAAAADSADWLNARVDNALADHGLAAADAVFCGFSQGAMVALLAGLRRDAAPRGIVSIAGALMAPEDGFAPRGRPKVLLLHGAADQVVPVARSQTALLRLRAAQIDARLHVLPMLGHGIVPEAAPFGAAFIGEICA